MKEAASGIQILALPSNTHGCILHTGIAGAFWRYGATEKVGQKRNEKNVLSLSKRNKKDSLSACVWANLLSAFPAVVVEFRTAFPSYIWSTISKCLQLPGCGRYGISLRQRRYDKKKKDWLVSLSACRLSYPSVNGKIFTRFVDGLSFEFALWNPRRTPVLFFKFSLWIFRPYDLASRFGLTTIR